MPSRRATQSFNAAADFSATSNPNGVWSYGWWASRLSGFNLLPQSIKFDVDVTGALLSPAIADVWTGAPSGDVGPSVFHNPAPFVDTHSSYPFGCCAPYPVGGLGFHPGPNGENAKIRWTAPVSGLYKVKATFSGLDYGGQVGTTTDVAVLHSRYDSATGGEMMTRQLWTGNVIAFGRNYDQSFSGTVRVGFLEPGPGRGRSLAPGTVAEYPQSQGFEPYQYTNFVHSVRNPNAIRVMR